MSQQIALQILACGICPGGAVTPGDKIRPAMGCNMIGGGTGQVQVTLEGNDPISERDIVLVTPLAAPSFTAIIGVTAPAPGSPFFIVFRRGDTQALVDMPFSFVYYRMPVVT